LKRKLFIILDPHFQVT